MSLCFNKQTENTRKGLGSISSFCVFLWRPGFGLVAPRQQNTINQFDSRHTIESKSMRRRKFLVWNKISYFKGRKLRISIKMRVGKRKKFCTKHGAAVLIRPNQTLAVKRGRGRLPTLQTLKKVRLESKLERCHCRNCLRNQESVA